MNLRYVGILFLGVGLGLGACGGDDDEDNDSDDGSGGTGGTGGGTETVHCVVEDDMGAVTGCQDLALSGAGADAARQACEDEGGTVVSSCPTSGRVGRCSTLMGQMVLHFYEPDDPADVEEVCAALMGTWTAG